MGKSSSQTTGYWYPAIFQHGIGLSCDAILEFRGGSKVAWKGRQATNGTIAVNAPNLFGGEKDQGGIVGDLDVMLGGPGQAPNPYLVANLNATVGARYSDFPGLPVGAIGGLDPAPVPAAPAKVAAWRGFTTVVGKGVRLGANNPYPQKLSYKIERIAAAMVEVGDWYPEKATVVMLGSATGTPGSGGAAIYPFRIGQRVVLTDESIAARDRCTLEMATQEGFEYTATDEAFWFWRANESGLCHIKTGSEGNLEAVNNLVDRGLLFHVTALVKFLSGQLLMVILTPTLTAPPATPGGDWVNDGLGPHATSIGGAYLWVQELQSDTLGQDGDSLWAINPAHWLYYVHAHPEIGREPTGNFNDANWRASADTLHAEGFGICVAYDPDKESLEEHTQRIGKLIGGSVNRGLDGQLYLDLARGDYVLADLPILTDDDVLDFRELPSVLDGVVNSVSVKYFDPDRKEYIITPPDVDHALVDAFGMIHQVNEYPEISTAQLAGRVARRDRLTTTTPTHAYELVTKTTPYGWRPNRYFRLQLPRRGIADMVCVLGEKQSGTLKSGAMRIKAVQDIYSLPATSFVEDEPGDIVAPPQIPTPITLQKAYEAPYLEAVQRIARAELSALPGDVGYLQAVAADLAGQRDFTLMVADAGGAFVEAGSSAWCPVAQTAIAYGRTDTLLQLRSAVGLADVLIGSAALWDNEIVRIDAVDLDAGTITVGRACADTVPVAHGAGSLLWCYDNSAAASATEYTDGETVDVKLLSHTTSAQLDLAEATAMTVEFAQRIARPYPPAKLRLNDEADPTYLFGTIIATWVHRDRIAQADQLLDTEAATTGPEAGTTYTVRTYVDDVLDDTQTGIAGATASVTPSADGTVRIEIESERDGLPSWQAQVREFAWTATETEPLMAEDGQLITTESGDPITLE